mmetsp:Transcript_28349/g.44973  ORF Transcript_28349/g.44973 Transcript_28349/m.44973 type:complete len:148 (+) Transcript_28349:1230-1673(+)
MTIGHLVHQTVIVMMMCDIDVDFRCLRCHRYRSQNSPHVEHHTPFRHGVDMGMHVLHRLGRSPCQGIFGSARCDFSLACSSLHHAQERSLLLRSRGFPRIWSHGKRGLPGMESQIRPSNSQDYSFSILCMPCVFPEWMRFFAICFPV